MQPLNKLKRRFPAILPVTAAFSHFQSTGFNNYLAEPLQTVQTPNSPNPGSESFLLTGEASSLFLASKDGNTFVPLTLNAYAFDKNQ